MSIGRLLFFVVVIALIAGGIAWQQGFLQIGPNGVAVNDKPVGDDVDIYTKANAQFEAFHYKEALDDFKLALQQHPKDPQAPTAAYLIGKCLAELKQTDQAIQAYKDFIAQYPTDERVDKAKEIIEKLNALK